MSCSVCCRCDLDPALLWLWCRVAAAAPIRPLAWKPPHAMGEALKRLKKKKKDPLILGFLIKLWEKNHLKSMQSIKYKIIVEVYYSDMRPAELIGYDLVNFI